MAKGFNELVLIPALRKQGLTVREATAVIKAIFDSIKDALARHEQVKLPIGTFAVVQNKDIELGIYRIDFLTSSSRPPRKKKLTKIEPTESAKTEPAKIELTESKLPQDELTSAAELIVSFIRENIQPGNRSLFYDELRIGPATPAMFKRTRPQSHERLPLNEAAQVIAECKSQQMPEESWDHLYACIAWFARWSQRVIYPNAVWKQAMQQAKNTLIG